MIIHVWSGPRSLSTAFMYSFGQRSDTTVIDEPLYAYWLSKNPQIFRPYREELLTSLETDADKVMTSLATMEGKPIVLTKQIAKQYTGVSKSHLHQPNTRHIFLVRHPLDMLEGWERRNEVHQEKSTLENLSLPQLLEIYSEVRTNGQYPPIIVDVDLLQTFPSEVMQIVCAKLSIPFMPEMLRWEAGPKPDMDGLWAPHWYHSAHKSTGFHSFSHRERALKHQSLAQSGAISMDLFREALPFYDILRRKAIGVHPLNAASSNTEPWWGDLPEGFCFEATSKPPTPPLPSSVSALGDPRNADVWVWVGDRLCPRDQAKVSVFDSSVQGGDAVWEGLRVYKGKVFHLQEHLNRLLDSAQTLAYASVPSRAYIQRAIASTLLANNMHDGVHIRLTLTRGTKVTSSMNPIFNRFGCVLIVLAEFKAVGDMTTYDNSQGITLITAALRRHSPSTLDSKIHHCNMLNNIIPKLQANLGGAHDAVMLDQDGFVSETNATNLFLVRDGVVLTPSADHCLPGITRATVLHHLCPSLGLPAVERRISLSELYTADEVFTTGTMGELTPVRMIDGRLIGFHRQQADRGAVTKKLQGAYRELTETQGDSIELLLGTDEHSE